MAQHDTTALLWEGRSPARRGPKPTLSLDLLAATGVGIADAEGLDAVSMQRVAAELDFTKMSLYRYVASKAELIAVMIELAVGEPPQLGRIRNGWRRKVEVWARALAGSWEAHPWLPWATVGDRVMGPREVGWVECALTTLAETRLTPREQLDGVFLLFGHMRNTQSLATAGTQPWTGPQQAAVLDDHRSGYPLLAATTEAARPSPDQGRAFGLACILDGLEALHASRASLA